MKTFSGVNIVNRNVSGLMQVAIFFDTDSASGFEMGWKNLCKFLIRAGKDGKAEDIQNMYIAPSQIINVDTDKNYPTGDDFDGGADGHYWTLVETYTPYKEIHYFNKLYSWSDYTPKNNKLFIYPYNYLEITNNIGNTKTYRYEDWQTPQCYFDIIARSCMWYIL